MKDRVLLRMDVKSSNTGLKYRFVEVGWFRIPTQYVHTNKTGFEIFCKDGCKNYCRNGGCPPLAPRFEQIKKKHKNMLVIWARLPKSQMPQSYYRDNMDSKYFFCISFAIKALPPVMNQIRVESKKIWKPDMYIGESECKVCGKNCIFKTAEYNVEKLKKIRCVNPRERVFSLESTGVDVDLLMRHKAFPLLWYGRGKKSSDIPYTAKVSGYLYKGDIIDRDITQDLIDMLNKKQGYQAKRLVECLEG